MLSLPHQVLWVTCGLCFLAHERSLPNGKSLVCAFFLCTQMLGGPHLSYEPQGVLKCLSSFQKQRKD